MLFAEALESVKCLDEGVIESVADANIGSILGIGFPGWTGGVLQYINGYDGGVRRLRGPRARAGREVRRALRAAGVARREGRARRELQRRTVGGRGRLADRRDVDHEAVAHRAAHHALVGVGHLAGADQLDLGLDGVLGAEVEHLLGVGQAADR